MSVLPPHEIALEIGGSAYLGWTRIDVTRGIDTASGEFALELAAKERTGAEDWPIADGAACRVTLGGKALITGWIDGIERFLEPEERGISVRGRDKAADLVDCSAMNKPGSWQNQKLEVIARAIAAPFGVTIDIAGDTGAPFKRFALQQSETAFAAIERLARQRGLALWSPGDGTLRLGNPDTGLRAGAIEEGRNILAIRASRDVSDRFSRYTVKGQSSGDDSRHGAQAAQVSGEAFDAQVSRYRPLLIIGEEQADAASLKKRAAWEAAVRSGKGRPVQVTLPGWFDDAGTVWTPGSRSRVKARSCRVDDDMLIQSVRLARSADEGTRAELALVPPEAWTQLAEPEEKAS